MVPSAAELRLDARIWAQRGVFWVHAQRGDHISRLFHHPWRLNPYPSYARMRAAGPVYRSPLGVRAVTSHAVVREVLRNRSFGVLNSAGIRQMRDFPEVDLSFLERDPPQHTRLRALARPAFSPRKLAEYRPLVKKATEELLDTAARRGQFDLIRDFAAPLPIAVISRLLGIPDADNDRFSAYGAAMASLLDGVSSHRQQRRVYRAARDLDALFADLLLERRRAPQDDVLSVLAVQDWRETTPAEARSLARLLLIAGFETTVNLIGNAVRALLRHRGQWERLCADPGLAAGAAEETLRFDPPVQHTTRFAHTRAEAAGLPVPQDGMLLLVLGATGRDPAVFPDPDRFDITRGNAAEHLAFSSGIHYCLGAPLARLEAEVALSALAQRFPKLRPAARSRPRRTITIRGLASCPVATGQ